MSENQEEKGPEGVEEKKGGKLLPILLGVIVVVGAAIGTVAFVLPPDETPKEAVSITDKRFPIRRSQPMKVVWTLGTKIGQVEFRFCYRVRTGAEMEMQSALDTNMDRLKAAVLAYLSDKTPTQVGGPRGLSTTLVPIVERSLFPDEADKVSEADKNVHVSEVLVTDYYPPRH